MSFRLIACGGALSILLAGCVQPPGQRAGATPGRVTSVSIEWPKGTADIPISPAAQRLDKTGELLRGMTRANDFNRTVSSHSTTDLPAMLRAKGICSEGQPMGTQPPYTRAPYVVQIVRSNSQIVKCDTDATCRVTSNYLVSLVERAGGRTLWQTTSSISETGPLLADAKVAGFYQGLADQLDSTGLFQKTCADEFE